MGFIAELCCGMMIYRASCFPKAAEVRTSETDVLLHDRNRSGIRSLAALLRIERVIQLQDLASHYGPNRLS